jgi:hypothetical protein
VFELCLHSIYDQNPKTFYSNTFLLKIVDISRITLMEQTNLKTTSGKLSNPPTLIEKNKLRFLLMDAPSDSTLPLYLKVVWC